MVKPATIKPPTSASSAIESLSTLELRNVVWAAIEKIGNKEKQGNPLPQGSTHHVSLQIHGEIDGQAFCQEVNSIINLGFAQTKSSSVNPQVPELIAYILSKLNRATRDRILTDIPEEFIAAGSKLPEPRPVLVDEAKQMLKKLRTSKKINARGAVRCEYTM